MISTDSPAAVSTAAVSRAKSAERWRASKPITAFGAGSSPATASTWAATPAAARWTTARFIPMGPAPIAARRPAVPNCRVPLKRSASVATASRA